MNRKTFYVVLCTAGLWVGGVTTSRAALADGLTPGQLRCEEAVNPLGVDVPQPRLFWKVVSAERGQTQSARQILVASTAELIGKDTGDLWDSGKVMSDETAFVRYAGKDLKSSQKVFWKVRVWDKDGKMSAWSAPANWTMGLLVEEDPSDRDQYSGTGWDAVWICAPAATEALLLRKDFAVKPGLVRAIVHVTGLGQYEMELNGTRAGDELLSPGWTDYDRTVLYDTKDVTGLVHEGPNAIGLMLGNGMYNVERRNRFVKFVKSHGPLRAICQLELYYADGSKQIVKTDNTWRTLAGPVIFSNMYSGEDYDARLEPQGWSQPMFDERAWPAAVVMNRPEGTLRGMTEAAPPIKAVEARKTVAMLPLKTDTNVVVYDLGQNASYLPRLRVTGPAGTTVRMMPGEILNEDGTVNRGTMGGTSRGLSWWEYTKGTDEEELWRPRFCYIGCRYLQVTRTAAKMGGELPEIGSIEGIIVQSTAPAAGEFECSNELLNRTRTIVRWAQRANIMSVLTDCPHREKLGWLEQDHLNGPALRYEFDLSRNFSKIANDMSEAQLPDGMVPNVAPEYPVFKGAFRSAAEWGASFILVPWQQYQFDGDTDILRSHYDRMKRYFAFLESRTKDGILSDGLGDWFDLGPRKPGTAQLTPPPVTATAFYYYDAWALSQIAAVLGESADTKHFTERAAQIRTNYNAHFYNAATANYATGSQCADALPLVMGIVEPKNRAGVLAALVHDVEAHGYAMTAGDVGFRFLLQALAQGGRSDVIYKMINQDDKPGYGYILKKGETSMTESWDANKSTSHNHFMLGQITEWFYKDLAGIDDDLTGAGFKKIIIHPAPVGDLTHVRASYDSIHGPIVSDWKRDGDKFTLDVTIPANTTATVFMPAKSEREVTEGGQPVAKSDGVKFLREEDGRAVFAVGSGEYVFEAKF